MIRLKILTVLCSLLFLNFLYAADYSQDYHEHKKNHIHKNLDYLNLNPQQLEEIKNILMKYRRKYEEYSKEKVSKEKKLQELVREDEFDKEKYEKILEDIYEEAAELETKVIKKIHSVLNKEQRKKFSFYLKEWKVE